MSRIPRSVLYRNRIAQDMREADAYYTQHPDPDGGVICTVCREPKSEHDVFSLCPDGVGGYLTTSFRRPEAV